MNIKKVMIFFLMITLFLAVYLPAEEKENLQVSYYKMFYYVIANEDFHAVTFLTHVPIITEDSIPVLIRLPRENDCNLKVKDFNFKTMKADKNLIRFRLENCMKDVKNYIVFEVFTLQKVKDFTDIPGYQFLSAYSSLSSDIKYFLQPSFTVQSSESQIKKKARELFYQHWDGNVMTLLNDIIYFTGDVIEGQSYGNQTALSTLERGYAVCTGKANLATALCRSVGIPARVLFVLPTHYIMEAYIPGYGWVRGESTQAHFPYAKNNSTVQWIADIDDENFAGHRGGVIAYWGVETGNAQWGIEYEYIYVPGNAHTIENFVQVEGNTDLNQALFEKGAELWRLFCQLKNSVLTQEQLSTFSVYQQSYYEALVNSDIQSALQFADLAISEAQNLLN